MGKSEILKFTHVFSTVLSFEFVLVVKWFKPPPHHRGGGGHISQFLLPVTHCSYIANLVEIVSVVPEKRS